MAPRPEKSHHVLGFSRYTIDPIFLMRVHSATLGSTPSPSFPHLICSPSSAASQRPSFSLELAGLPQGSCLLCSAPASEAILRAYPPTTTTANTARRYVSPPKSPGTSPPRDVFYSFSSLPESPQLLTTSATPQQHVNVFSTASPPPTNKQTAAVTRAEAHTTPAFLVTAAPAKGPAGVKWCAPPTLKNTAEEKHRGSFALFQNSDEVLEKWSPRRPPTASPEFSPATQSCASTFAGAGQPAVSLWEPADGCFRDREARLPFEHIVPSWLRNSFSLQGHTLLSPPATAFSPAAEETEALHAGLRLDSPLYTHLSSPTSVHDYNHDDPGVICHSAISGASEEASGPHSPALYPRSSSTRHLPVYVSILSISPETPFSPRHWPCDAQLCRLSMHEMYPAQQKARQSAGAPPKEPTGLPDNLGPLPSVEDEVQRLMGPTYKEAAQAVVSTEMEVEGSTAKRLGKEQNNYALHYTEFEEEQSKDIIRSTSAMPVYSLACNKPKACGSSLCVPRGQQTTSGSSVSPRGNNRRKRRRGASPRRSQGSTPISVEPSLQSQLRCRKPATVAATDVGTCSEPRLAMCLNQNPIGLLPPATSPDPSDDAGGSIFCAGDIAGVNQSVAPAGVNHASARFPALHTIDAPGAFDPETVLPTNYPKSEASTVADSTPVAPFALTRGPSSHPADESLGISPSRALCGFDLHFRAGDVNEHRVFYPDLSPCMAHGNGTIRGPLTPVADSTHRSAPSASLPPGAIVYALAVKLFGFTPTPGFLPDPNPFDDPEHYLTKKLKRATVSNTFSSEPLRREDTGYLYGPQVPATVTAERVLADTAFSPTAAGESGLLISGSTNALTEPHFSPSHQRGKKRGIFLSSGSEYAQPRTSGHEHVIEEKTSMAGNRLYSYTVPPAPAIPLLVCRENAGTAHSRMAAASALPITGNAPESTRYSQELATAEYRQPSRSSISNHQLPGGQPGAEGWYTQGGAHPQVTPLANTIEYVSDPSCSQQGEGTVADCQTQNASVADQRTHTHEVGECAQVFALMNGSSFVFDKSDKSERNYIQNGDEATAYEALQVYDGGGQVMQYGRRPQVAQIPLREDPCAKATTYTEEDTRCDCVTGINGIGRKFVSRGRTYVHPEPFYGRSADPAGEPVRNSTYLQAADDVRYRESGIYVPTYLHGERSLFPSRRSPDEQPFSQCRLEVLDRTNEAFSPNIDVMIDTPSTRQHYKLLPNPPYLPPCTRLQDGAGDNSSPDFSVNGEAACAAATFTGDLQHAVSLYGE